MNIEDRHSERGADALRMLKSQDTGETPDGLFEAVVGNAVEAARPRGSDRFWKGTVFGGAVAASIFAAVILIGGQPQTAADDPASFRIALHEPRSVDIAIETDRALQGASISILLAGKVAITGYEDQRELSWSENLDEGINRLSLPIIATGDGGGQVVVRVSHPQSEQVFVLDLETDV